MLKEKINEVAYHNLDANLSEIDVKCVEKLLLEDQRLYDLIDYIIDEYMDDYCPDDEIINEGE